MKDYEYNKLTKAALIKKLQEAVGTKDRQTNTITRLTRESKETVSKLKEANNTIESLNKKVKALENRPIPNTEVLEQRIKNQEQSIKKLIGYIDEFIGAAGDTHARLKAFINMSENAFKTIIEDIQKG